MNGVLDTYEHTIKLIQSVVDAHYIKLDNLIEFCNGVVRDLPWKLNNALEDKDENNTHHLACQLVLLCERMMRRFKSDLKELK